MLLNGEEVETVDWTRRDHVILLQAKPGMNQIDVFVENCGRVNYADFDSNLLNNQRKGQQLLTREPDTSATRHFGTKTLRHHKIGAEV